MVNAKGKVYIGKLIQFLFVGATLEGSIPFFS